MSFRNPFVTDFIYQASEDTRGVNPLIKDLLVEHGATISHEVDERGYGYFSGTFRTLDGSTEEQNFSDLTWKLGKVTKVPFRLTVLYESGPSITYEIRPRP